MDLAFDPNGRRLAVACRHHVKLLDAASGEEVLVLRGFAHVNPDTNGFNPRVRFSRDGRRIAAVCHDVTAPVSIWSVEEAEPDPAARLRTADRRAAALHLWLAGGYANDPNKQPQLRFHLKWLEGVGYVTAEQYTARGRLYTIEGQHDRAAADSAGAAELAPAVPAVHYDCGAALAAAGRWQQSLPYFDRYAESAGGQCHALCFAAYVALYAGDRARFDRYLLRARAQFGGSEDVAATYCLAGLEASFPGVSVDPAAVLRQADRCLKATEGTSNHAWVVMVKGIAEYRAGRLEPAVVWLTRANEVVPHPNHRAGIQFFLAMAYHRLGRANPASAAYRQALRKLEEEFGSADRHTPAKRNDWHVWPWCQLIRSEAEALPKQPPAPPKE